MKKSECYKLAQVSVLRDYTMEEFLKLEVLRTLISMEDLALFSEKQEDESA